MTLQKDWKHFNWFWPVQETLRSSAKTIYQCRTTVGWCTSVRHWTERLRPKGGGSHQTWTHQKLSSIEVFQSSSINSQAWLSWRHHLSLSVFQLNWMPGVINTKLSKIHIPWDERLKICFGWRYFTFFLFCVWFSTYVWPVSSTGDHGPKMCWRLEVGFMPDMDTSSVVFN